MTKFFCHLTHIRKAAQGWKKARTMQAYPKSGIQNNKGRVSATLKKTHPSCV